MNWPATLPRTDSNVTQIQSESDDIRVDFTRLCVTDLTDNGADDEPGPGQVVFVPGGKEIDFYAMNVCGIQPTDPLMVAVLIAAYPNTININFRKISHPVGSGPPSSLAAATLHTAYDDLLNPPSSQVSDDSLFGSPGVVDTYDPVTKAVTLTAEAYDIAVGKVLSFIDPVSGDVGIGVVASVVDNTEFTLEHTVGGPTLNGGVDPMTGFEVQQGRIEFIWVPVFFDGTETPNAYRGIRVKGLGGGGDLCVMATCAIAHTRGGLVIAPLGAGGSGHESTLLKLFHTKDAGGVRLPAKWLRALLRPLETTRRCFCIIPAQQPADVVVDGPASMDDWVALLHEAGYADSEIAQLGDSGPMASATTLAITSPAASGGGAAWDHRIITVNPGGDIVRIQGYRKLGCGPTQIAYGFHDEIAHPNVRGMIYMGRAWKTILGGAATGGETTTPPGEDRPRAVTLRRILQLRRRE